MLRLTPSRDIYHCFLTCLLTLRCSVTDGSFAAMTSFSLINRGKTNLVLLTFFRFYNSLKGFLVINNFAPSLENAIMVIFINALYTSLYNITTLVRTQWGQKAIFSEVVISSTWKKNILVRENRSNSLHLDICYNRLLFSQAYKDLGTALLFDEFRSVFFNFIKWKVK